MQKLFLATCIAFVWTLSTGADTTVSQSSNQFVNSTQLTSRQRNSTVTIELKLPQNGSDLFNDAKYRRLRELIVRKRNKKFRTAIPTITVPTPVEHTTVTDPPTVITDQSTTEFITTSKTDPPTVVTVQSTAAFITTSAQPTTKWVPWRRRRDVTQPAADEQYTTGDILCGELDTRVEDGIMRAAVVINKEATRAPCKRRRLRRVRDVTQPDADEEFTIDDILFVELDPIVKDGVIRVSVFINKEVSDDLLEILKELDEESTLEQELNFAVNEGGRDGGIYRGLPVDVDPPVQEQIVKAGIGWRFYLVVLILVVCFIILVFAIFCVIRHRTRMSPVANDKDSRVSEEPIVTHLTEPTSKKPSPNGHPGLNDVDWIIPYEQALLLRNNDFDNSVSAQITPL